MMRRSLRYFEANQDDFHAPEQVRLEYLEISRDDVAAEIPVDEEAVRPTTSRTCRPMAARNSAVPGIS
jgi:hypothetical protein